MSAFVDTYSRVLLDLAGREPEELVGQPLYSALTVGRRKLIGAPALLDQALSRVPKAHPTVVAALRRLDYGRWVYLRDTKRYSIFIDPQAKKAYAVVALNDPIHDMLGGTGVFVETAVCPLGSEFICDGLFANPVFIGRNIRAEFSYLYTELKAAGHFHRKP